METPYKNNQHCRAFAAASYLFSVKSAYPSQPGATPQDFRLPGNRAVKARFNPPASRACSAADLCLPFFVATPLCGVRCCIRRSMTTAYSAERLREETAVAAAIPTRLAQFFARSAKRGCSPSLLIGAVMRPNLLAVSSQSATMPMPRMLTQPNEVGATNLFTQTP